MEAITLSNIQALANERVDFEKKIIYGTSICMEGEALGHNTWLSSTFISDLVALANAKGKISVHLGHYNQCSTQDEMNTILGVAKNFRVEGTKALADIHFIYTEKDAQEIDKILKWTSEHPTMFGQSIVFQMKQVPSEREQDGEYDYDDDIWDTNLYEADPEGKGRKFATISEIISTDIVEHPAANADGMFAQFGSKEPAAKEVTTFLSRVKKFMPAQWKGFLKIVDSLSKADTAPKPKPKIDVAQKKDPEISTTNNPKKMSFFNRMFKKKQAEITPVPAPEPAPRVKFGQAVDADGIVYDFEGDFLKAGHELIIVSPNGDSEIAEPHDYEMTTGEIVTVGNDGLIIKVVAAPATPADPNVETAAEVEADALRAAQVKKIAELERREEALKEQLKAATGTVSNTTILTSKQNQNMELSNSEKASLFRVYRAFKKGNTKGLSKAEKAQAARVKIKDCTEQELQNQMAKMHVNFATGANFIGSVVNACIKYFDQIQVSDIFTDSLFLSKIKNVTELTPYNSNNVLDAKIPLFDLQDAVGTTALIPAATVCGIPTNTVVAVLSEKTMKISPFQLNWSVCPKDSQWRLLFNQMVFIDELTIPMEVIIMNQIMEVLLKNQVDLIINAASGYGGYGAFTQKGIVRQLVDDVTAALIPAAQLKPLHTNWTVSNVGGYIYEAIEAIPEYIKEKSRMDGNVIGIFLGSSIFDLFRSALQNGLISNFIYNPLEGNIYAVPNSLGLNIEFVPVSNLNRTSGGNNTSLYFINFEDRIFHHHSDKLSPNPGSPFVERMPVDGTIYVQFAMYEGASYPFAKDFVTNIS